MRRKYCVALAAAAALAFGSLPQAQGSRTGIPPALFLLGDANKDGALTREELSAAFGKWPAEWDTAKAGSLAQDQLVAGLTAALPAPPPFPPPSGPQNQTPNPAHVEAMVAALPDKAPATPKQPRKVLVLAKAAGFVHSSIPLAARTVEEMGRKTGAWTTTITYDSADVNEKNLKQYDAIFLASTTGHFLDDPADAAATAARRKALLDFVRGGKGLAAIHAASDSYHRTAPDPAGPRPARNDTAMTLASQLVVQGDKNSDGRLTRDELTALAGTWFDRMDASKAGRVTQQELTQRLDAVIPPPPPRAMGATGFPVQAPASAAQRGADRETPTWPEFNKMIGGFFKFHWNDGQEITVKVDEPNHPLNAPFKGQPAFVIVDETYTFGRSTYSRDNLRVLTSVDYDKMSAEDKAKEQFPRADGDYALSWIRREGKGRVFYEAHGHNEKVYANKLLLAHVLHGIQYALGDLPADDAPSAKGGTK